MYLVDKIEVHFLCSRKNIGRVRIVLVILRNRRADRFFMFLIKVESVLIWLLWLSLEFRTLNRYE